MPRKRDGSAADLRRRVDAAFGRRLAEARASANLLQQELGQKMGLSRTSISNIERGSRAVYLDQVFQAANILGVELSELLPSLDRIYPNALLYSPDDDRVSEERALS